MSSHRAFRYGAPVATAIVGVLFAAADTNSVGNTVATVLIAAGLIWLMVNLGRDMGMTARSDRRPPAPTARSQNDDPTAAPPAQPPISPS